MLSVVGAHAVDHLAISNEVVGIVVGLLVVITTVAKGPRWLDAWATRRITRHSRDGQVHDLVGRVDDLAGDVDTLKEGFNGLHGAVRRIEEKLTNGSSQSPADLISKIAQKLGIDP